MHVINFLKFLYIKYNTFNIYKSNKEKLYTFVIFTYKSIYTYIFSTHCYVI